MGKIVLYRWRYFDDLRNKLVTTKHVDTEENFLKSHPGAEKIPGSQEIRDAPEDPYQNCTSNFLRNK